MIGQPTLTPAKRINELVVCFFDGGKDPDDYDRLAAAMDPLLFKQTYKAYNLQEDALQEARLRIWMQLYKMEEAPDNPCAYLSMIAKYSTVDCLKKGVKSEEVPMPDSLETKETQDPTTPWDILEKNERTSLIYDFLGTIAKQQHRQIALLHWSCGYSKAETAKLLECNESSVNTIIGRLEKKFLKWARRSQLFEATACGTVLGTD